MASETTELLTTLGRLAASTSKIDESVQRIALALEQTLNSGHSPLTNDEKEEEIAFLKKYVKMRHTQDKSFEENLKQKDDSIEEMKAIILENEKLISDKEKSLQEMEATMATMLALEDHEALMFHKKKLIQQKDGIISARGRTIAELTGKLAQRNKALDTNGEKYWSDFIEKVLEEVEGVQQETGHGQFNNTAIKHGAKKFLAIVHEKALEKANLALFPASEVSGVKHKLEGEMSEDGIKRVKMEREE